MIKSLVRMVVLVLVLCVIGWLAGLILATVAAPHFALTLIYVVLALIFVLWTCKEFQLL